jgi:hypothetical protein
MYDSDPARLYNPNIIERSAPIHNPTPAAIQRISIIFKSIQIYTVALVENGLVLIQVKI